MQVHKLLNILLVTAMLFNAGCAVTAAAIGSAVAYSVNESHKKPDYLQEELTKDITDGTFLVLVKDDNSLIAGNVLKNSDIEKAKTVIHKNIPTSTIYSYLGVNVTGTKQYDKDIYSKAVDIIDNTKVGVIYSKIYVLTDKKLLDSISDKLLKINHVDSVIIVQTKPTL